jgi:hypothetical protein
LPCPARIFLRLPLPPEGRHALRQAGNLLLQAAERGRMLFRQLGADLADLPAELAQSLLHVGQSIAVAPVGIPDLAGDPP